VTNLQPTSEQQAILDAAVTGVTLAISAAAGSGKTSTLRMIAEARPKTQMLYLAFNKAIQVEADGSFPPNVTCKTAHALAYRRYGAPLRKRLNGPRMTGKQNAVVLGITTPLGLDADRCFSEAALASMALSMVACFCRSADPQLAARHFRAPEGLTPPEESEVARSLLPYAHRAWADLTSGEQGKLKPTHDVYLKQWQLSQPELSGWDVLLYDETQDADPCISAVVARQHHAQLIAVGDSAQAIYRWRGAGDFLARIDADHRLALTQSWRFGQAVADEANVWLGVVGTDLRVVGNPGRESTLDILETPDAVLCRSNAGTIEQLLAAHDRGVKVHLVGDGKEMRSLAEAAQRLQDGKLAAHPELVAFTTWQQVVEYAENDPAGSDLAVAVRMIERHGADEVIRAVDGTVPAERADLRVSTAHKAKGLEWNQVRIGTDYRQPLDKTTGEPLPIPREDAMLAYVAVTRAKSVLDNTGLAWVHTHLDALGALAGETVDRELTARAATPSTPVYTRPDSTAGVAKGDDGDQPEVDQIEADTRSTLMTRTPRSADPRVEYSTCAEPTDGVTRLALSVGSSILVAEERGTFVIHGFSKDGSVLAYRPDGRGGARSFRPEWCVPVTRVSKTGKPVKVRTVPAEARAARDAWRAQHSPHSTDILADGLDRLLGLTL
jgi:AAA domain/UvrD-like helicase C-terminal domain